MRHTFQEFVSIVPLQCCVRSVLILPAYSTFSKEHSSCSQNHFLMQGYCNINTCHVPFKQLDGFINRYCCLLILLYTVCSRGQLTVRCISNVFVTPLCQLSHTSMSQQRTRPVHKQSEEQYSCLMLNFQTLIHTHLQVDAEIRSTFIETKNCTCCRSLSSDPCYTSGCVYFMSKILIF